MGREPVLVLVLVSMSVTFPRPIVGVGWVYLAGRKAVSAWLPTSQDLPIVICPELTPMIGIQHLVSHFCSAPVM